jgi:hypothetical protein
MGRFSRTAADALVADDPVTLEGGELGANRVVGHAQMRGQLLDGRIAPAEPADDATASAGEEAVGEGQGRHAL